MKGRCHLELNLTYLKKNLIKVFINTGLFVNGKVKQGGKRLHPNYPGIAINVFELLAIGQFHRLSLEIPFGHFWQDSSSTQSI